MAQKIGPGGEIVIEPEVRERLGIDDGWDVTQTVIDGDLLIRVAPPTHNRSLFGILRPFIPVDRLNATEEDLQRAIEEGFSEDWAEKERRIAEAGAKRAERSAE